MYSEKHAGVLDMQHVLHLVDFFVKVTLGAVCLC